MAKAADVLKVMSFNVRTPVDLDGDKRWQLRRDSIVALLRQHQPDIIGTQELGLEQATYLVTQLPNYLWLGRDRRGGEHDEHMGVFFDRSRLRVVESGDFWLSNTPELVGSISWGNAMPRMVTWGMFERRSDGRRFYVYNTHFPYRAQDESARILSAQLILKQLERLPQGIPVALLGDFNAIPGSATHQALTEKLLDARVYAPLLEGPDATFHGFTGNAERRLDWILLRDFQIERFATLDQRPFGIFPSDHYPVMAELNWP